MTDGAFSGGIQYWKERTDKPKVGGGETQMCLIAHLQPHRTIKRGGEGTTMAVMILA